MNLPVFSNQQDAELAITEQWGAVGHAMTDDHVAEGFSLCRRNHFP